MAALVPSGGADPVGAHDSTSEGVAMVGRADLGTVPCGTPSQPHFGLERGDTGGKQGYCRHDRYTCAHRQ